MNQSEKRLFRNTQEAVAFGETATLEEMSVLLKKTYQVLMTYLMDMSFEMQFFDEAYHAFKKDEWYSNYCKTEDGNSGFKS